MKNFGLELLKQRMARGWSRSALADKCDLCHSTIYNIERGATQNPSYRVLNRLKTVLPELKEIIESDEFKTKKPQEDSTTEQKTSEDEKAQKDLAEAGKKLEKAKEDVLQAQEHIDQLKLEKIIENIEDIKGKTIKNVLAQGNSTAILFTDGTFFVRDRKVERALLHRDEEEYAEKLLKIYEKLLYHS